MYMLLFNLFQRDITCFCETWNMHRIRKRKLATSPAGQPLSMFAFAELYAGTDFIEPLNVQLFEVCAEQCSLHDYSQPNGEAFELLQILMAENNIYPPQSASEAVSVYIDLRELIQSSIGN